MENNTLVEKWMERQIDEQKLVSEIQSRMESQTFGLNEEGTRKRMFLQTVITDAYTRWTTVELAFEYGFITEEARAFFYENDLYEENFENQFDAFEWAVCLRLKEKTNLKGKFTFKWAEPISEKTENYFGICYEEAV